jgi:hypothetical protein
MPTLALPRPQHRTLAPPQPLDVNQSIIPEETTAMKLSALLALVAGTVVFGMVSGVEAQARPRRAPRVIQLEEIVIEGRVQKPNAFYILNRSNLGYEVLDLRTSFIREVVRTVQRDPF